MGAGMGRSTRYALGLMAWLAAGFGVTQACSVMPGGVAWWLLAGVPAALVMLTLAAGFAMSVIGLALAMSVRPARR